jgi:hypothetical protein
LIDAGVVDKKCWHRAWDALTIDDAGNDEYLTIL